MAEPADSGRDNPGFLAYKIVGLYALFGGLWILLSDRLLWAMVTDPYWNRALQTYKGWFYVAVTAVFLYLLIRQALARMKRLEAARLSAEQKFLQAQKMELVGRLASGVAHDFNNVLTAIMGLAQMTRETMPENDPRSADIDDILKFSERAAAITAQLLAFSRKQFSQPRPLDLAAQIKNAEKMLRRATGEAVEIEIKLAAGMWRVMADPCQMDQVLLNLAVNARDSMPQGGKLSLTAANTALEKALSSLEGGLPPGEYVTITIRDSGSGMDQATLARIFEPFFTTKEPGKGTGLGLSVVHGIVAQAGGSITVESRPGEGTAFCIYLPKYSGLEPAPAPEPVKELSAGGKETILLVDDQPEILQVMRRILEGRGYAVLGAGSYEEALAQAAAAKSGVGILVTDTVLHGKNGPDLADRLIEMSPDLKVLFISGQAADPAVQDRILIRHRPFLAKPFTPEALLTKVRQTLDSPGA
jgi:signal transduction histidine kinase